MNVPDPIFGMLLVFAFPVAMVLLIRLLLPHDDGLYAPIVLGGDPEWPRGVQEEEPVRYRVELVGSARRFETAQRSRPRPATYIPRPASAD
jgi:hypothetical protein